MLIKCKVILKWKILDRNKCEVCMCVFARIIDEIVILITKYSKTNGLHQVI